LSSELPLPPVPFDLTCNVETWDAEKPIIRVHHSAFGATEFNPGRGKGRFHPISAPTGMPVPTLYGSSTFEGALSETVFHDVPVRGPGKAVEQSSLMPMLSSTLLPMRPLRLVQLRGFGLNKLGLTRAELVESEADQYVVTRAWAAALYTAFDDVDGLTWMSRQHDSSGAIVLFGTRVQRHELTVAAAPRSLYPPSPGWHDVLVAAEAADLTILMP
jgi:RES domain